MMFDNLCVDLIKSGKKTATRRIKRNDRRPAKPGTIHKLKIDRTKDVYGYIFIHKCEAKPYIWILDDEDAKREGFDTAFEFLNYWESVNKDYKGEWIWVVEFEYLGDDFDEAYGKIARRQAEHIWR